MINTIMLIIIALNSFFALILLLSIYGKAESIIEYKERQSQAIIDLVNGFLEGFKGFIEKK